jgi:predicted DNA-binding transcriptional regulator YafY
MRGRPHHSLVLPGHRRHHPPLFLVLCATEIPHASIDFYAAHLLTVGTDVKVESSPELIGAIREKAQAVAKRYNELQR